MYHLVNNIGTQDGVLLYYAEAFLYRDTLNTATFV